MNKVKIKAYITLEASYIVPLMVAIFALIIYITFFEYNACVVYQDCYIAALRGSQLREMTESEIEIKTKQYADELLENQLHQYEIKPLVNVNILSVSVGASNKTDLRIPSYLSVQNSLESSKEASSSRLNPVLLIRTKY